METAINTNPVMKANLRACVAYGFITLFCFTFGLVYEHYGFGVTSPFMHLAFLIPLALGFLPCLVFLLLRRPLPFLGLSSAFWRTGIATLVVGSFFRGALDIYGTQSVFTAVYPVAGGLLLCACICSFLTAR